MNALRIIVLAVLSLLVTGSLVAQIDRANVKGTVTDPSGAVVAGAQVTVSFSQTGYTRSVQSTAAGEYVLPALPLGNCTVTAKADGFDPSQTQDVILTVGDNRTIDLRLGVKSIDQIVSVTAATVTLDKIRRQPVE